MTRTMRWTLCILGALLLVAGIVVGDANRRAWAAFEQHEKRVARMIAELRARHAAAPLHSDNPVHRLRRLVPPHTHPLNEAMKRRSDGEFFPYEGGWTYREYFFQVVDAIPKELVALDGPAFLSTLGALQDVIRAGGHDAAHARFSMEFAALDGWRATLSEHTLIPSEAREILKDLDALASMRPPVEDALLGEYLLECRTILKILGESQDPQGYVRRGPGWRSLFSWKILLVQLLNERTEEFRRLESIRGGTGRGYYDAVFAAEMEFDARRRHSALTPTFRAATCAKADAFIQDEIARARVATAVAGFEAQHGRPPMSIQELVPDWFPKVPLSPYSGAPFEVKDRRVFCPHDGLEPGHTHRRTTLEWIVKRKGY